MLRKSLKRRTAVFGGAALSVVILSGCGGPTLTLDGYEVSNLEEAIKSADDQWAQQRASGPASNIDDNSRCYAQTSDEVLSDQAICGPIHYLGDDDQTWETMDWQPAGEGKDKVQVFPSSTFSKGTPAPNATLYRTDGKEAPEGLVVPEPDAETSAVGQVVWSADTNVPEDGLKTSVRTPDAENEVAGMRVSDRIGDASSRLAAGDGNKFVSVVFRNVEESSLTDVAFISDGKTYPAGKLKHGKLSMAIPGDNADTVVALTYDGLTQTVAISDGKLDTKATAFYDGFEEEASGAKLADFREGPEFGTSVEFIPGSFKGQRTAYEPTAGWAPEGKAWLVVTGTPDTGPLAYKQKYGTSGGSISSSYDTVTSITAATVTNVSGTAFEAQAVRIDNGEGDDMFGNESAVTIVFEVPAGIGDFNVSMTINSAGEIHEAKEGVAPTASVDGSVPPFELTFRKQQ